MIICHIGTLGEFSNYGQITRDIVEKCEGIHIHADLYSYRFPKADIYLLHCFRNVKHLKAFKFFQKPFPDSKVISIIHSSEPCVSADCSDVVVTISQAWHDFMLKKYDINSVMIRGSLDWRLFDDVKIDYSKKVFGRHSRLEKGKFHKEWDKIIKNINNEYKLFSGEFKINDIDAKKKALNQLSVYAVAQDENGLCEETFSMALLEAMACGLPCIIYGKDQSAMCEVLGDAGKIIYDFSQFEYALKCLLNNETEKRIYGQQAKERAKLFDNQFMINQYNKLFEDILK